MKAMDLLVGLNSVRDAYVQDAQKFRQGKSRPKRLPVRKLWLAAALIALSLLLVGCAVVYVLRMQERKVGEVAITEGAKIDLSGAYVPATQWKNTLVSFQGYAGSPEQLALQEWLEFQAGYDQDNTLHQAAGWESSIPEQYQTYGCYTQEMMNKLDEILKKHQLKPLGPALYLNEWEDTLLYRALQFDSLCKKDGQVGELAGYLFPEGSFSGAFHHTLDGEERLTRYTYAQNGYLYPYMDSIREIDAWSQWDYTTGDGTQLLLAAYENRLKIFCQRQDAAIVISTENRGAEAMTRQEAENIADSFCYGIQPQPCDPAAVERMRKDYPQPAEEAHIMDGFRTVDGERWFPPEAYAGSYGQYLAYLLANENSIGNENVGQLQYAVTDLNGDGQPEILLQYADTGIYGQVLEMIPAQDGRQPKVSVRYIRGYVYEGPVFQRITDQTQNDGFIYHEYKDFSWENLDCLRYDPAADAWARSSTCADTPDAVWEPITAEALHALQSSYVPLSLDMQPLSRFSMEGW